MLLQVLHSALSVSPASLYDASYEHDDDILQLNDIHPDPELHILEQMMLREMAEDDPDMLSSSEEQVRDALSQSIHERNYRTLSAVMPILRSLSDKQRIALAALVAKHSKGKSSKSMDFSQVGIHF